MEGAIAKLDQLPLPANASDANGRHPPACASPAIECFGVSSELGADDPCERGQPSLSKHEHPDVLRAPDFIAQYVPLDHIVDGLPIVRGKVTALTGIPGHGKTAIATALLVHVAAGKAFAGREVTQCPVMMLCGESPEDFRLRLMASAQEAAVPASDLQNLLVVPATFNIAFELDYLEQYASSVGGVGLVVVDTSAAFFHGDSENENLDMHRHAVVLRGLTQLSGHPAVLALCHPRLNPTQQTLVPRGGGAFIAEIDANMSAFKTADGRVDLHWCGKIRGPAFNPISFELVLQTLGVMDRKGRPVTTIAARAIGIERIEDLDDAQHGEDQTVLFALAAHPGASLADLASYANLGDRYKVRRILKRLADAGMAEKIERSYHLSSKGEKLVRRPGL